MTQQALTVRQGQTLGTAGLTVRDVSDLSHPEKSLLFDLECDIMNAKYSSVFYVSSHEALPAVGLHGLALAGYPPRR